MGAAYMGAQKASYSLPRDYSKNICPIYKYSQNSCVTSALPQKLEAAMTSWPSGPGNGGARNTREEGDINKTVYESESIKADISEENGHGNIKIQVSEITAGIKSMVKEKPIST